MVDSFEKQPDDKLDYGIDLDDWLPASDKAISVSVNADSGITISSTNVLDRKVKIWIEGGEDRNNYLVSAEITTNEGRIKEVDFKIKVRQRGL